MKEFWSSPLTDTGDKDCFVVVRLNSVLGKVLQELVSEHCDFDPKYTTQEQNTG